MADTWIAGLCSDGHGGSCAIDGSRHAYVHATFVVEDGIHHHRCRSLRHHHQSLSVFLAGFAGSRRATGDAGSIATDTGAATGPNQFETHQARYVYRHGIFQPGRILHHPHGGCHPESARSGQYPDLGAGSNSVRPIAGEFAFFLFSAGIIGTGLLAIPVLAGASAYAMAGTFGWKNSLDSKLNAAKAFYAVIIVSTVVGTGLGFSAIDPIKALYWSAVVNGVISVPIMTVMMLMASRQDIMGTYVIRRKLRVLGWLAALMMAIAVVAMLATL